MFQGFGHSTCGRCNCNCKIYSSKSIVGVNLSISLTRYLEQVKRSMFRNMPATQLQVHPQCGKKWPVSSRFVPQIVYILSPRKKRKKSVLHLEICPIVCHFTCICQGHCATVMSCCTSSFSTPWCWCYWWNSWICLQGNYSQCLHWMLSTFMAYGVPSIMKCKGKTEKQK